MRELEPLTGPLLPAGESKGSASVDLEGTFDASGSLDAHGTIHAEGLGSQSPDGLHVLQDLGGDLAIEATRSPVGTCAPRRGASSGASRRSGTIST